jgi:hypothetical protein
MQGKVEDTEESGQAVVGAQRMLVLCGLQILDWAIEDALDGARQILVLNY